MASPCGKPRSCEAARSPPPDRLRAGQLPPTGQTLKTERGLRPDSGHRGAGCGARTFRWLSAVAIGFAHSASWPQDADMPDTSDTSPAFFGYLIESPSAADLFDGRTEGRKLCEFRKLTGVTPWYRIATNREMFEQALSTDVGVAVTPSTRFLSCTSAPTATMMESRLKDGSRIPWAELRHLLRPLNEALRGLLLLGLSSCYGVYGCRMAMHVGESLPFFAIVGHEEAVAWADAPSAS